MVLVGHPSKLIVEVTTRCNLQCNMCVKQNGSGGIPEGSMSSEIFEATIPAFPRLDSLVLNGIGEPLLHPHLEDFISKARSFLPEHASIGFQSNGMALTEQRARTLVEAGLDRICLSVDTVSDDSFRTIRCGGELEGIIAAFASLGKASMNRRRRTLQIGVEFVLMRSNIFDLPKVIRWAGGAGASFAIVTQILPYEKSFVTEAVYDTNTADAISIYYKWKTKAAQEGLDIRRYPDIFMKFMRSEEDEQIVNCIELMKQDAGRTGITLHVEKLLKRDEEWFAAARKVLDETECIAREVGIELTLPALAPQNSRRCEFVEGDSAFVSWDGDVHPCYFLWHRYACYIGGVEKKVKPWVLGSLRERNILAIWNDRESRLFRERVRGYKFPFCYDCSFALCDYVGDVDFEHDCYIENVPCGSCLWCTGLFHCLR